MGGQAVLVENQDLLLAMKRDKARRTIAGATAAAGPNRFPGADIVSEQRLAVVAAATDNHLARHNQRRTAVTPLLGLVAFLGGPGLVDCAVGAEPGIEGDVSLPNLFSGSQFKAVQQAGSAQGINLVIMDCWCGAGAFTGDGGVVVPGIGVQPEHGPGEQIITGDDFIFTALFLSDCSLAGDNESRPGRADRLSPQFHRRLGLPIGRQLRAGNLAVAARAQELRKRQLAQEWVRRSSARFGRMASERG